MALGAMRSHEIIQETGELTPTQTAKRAVVYPRFKDVSDSIYE
jgi:hypothetical protein